MRLHALQNDPRTTVMPPPAPPALRDDRLLAEACLSGDQEAWNVLIDKHKGLIYSIPFKYGLKAEDAADVFQDVCVALHGHLAQIRDPQALRGWLARVAAHECYRRKQALRRADADGPDDVEDPSVSPPEWLAEIERRETIREGVAQLQPRCQEMVRMLFYDDPPKPYQEVARSLGLAVGSIGFIRGRCLRQLERVLKELGL